MMRQATNTTYAFFELIPESEAVVTLAHKLVLIVAVSLFTAPSYASAQTVAAKESQQELKQSPAHAAKITAMLETYRQYGQFNGTVLVAEKGNVIVRQGFGLANMEWEIPNSPETKFRIGSVTKQFTAALILQLVEEGKVKLDQPMTAFLTDYRKDTGDKVTVHHLLNHTSGIPSYTTPEFFAEFSRESYGLDEFVSKFASGDLQFEPGAQFAYNNSGYHLLGAIIEKVTGKTYAECLKERILDPVGMSKSGFDVSATVLKNRAQGYEKTAEGYENAAYLDMGIPYSAGSMYSTVDDLFKWDRALYGNEVLSLASKELMFKPGMGDYGYGFVIEDQGTGKEDETTKVTHHGGGINGFNCLLSRAVDQDHCVIVLDNVSLGRHHDEITSAIIRILNDQPFDGPKKSLADALIKIASEQGGAATVKQYRSLKSDKPGEFDFGNEEALNGLGYHLVSLEKLDDAIELFKLNVEMFPEAFNPYDSLGEAYLANDQKDLALLNYKKSVELNPENEGGILAIKKIEGTATKIDASMLQSYVGKYEVQPGLVVTITLEDGKLMGAPTGQPKEELEPISETKFHVSSVKAKVEFLKSDDGTVSAMTLEQGDNKFEGKKIE